MDAQTFIVGLGGVILGGILSLIGVYLKERLEIEKININRDHEKSDTYLKNARMHLDDLYIPLFQTISTLCDDYFEVRDIFKVKGEKVGDVGKAAVEKFKDTYLKFSETYCAWVEKGLTSYFIYDLDEKCILLRNLIRNSLNESEIHIENDILITMSTPIGILKSSFPFISRRNFIQKANSNQITFIPQKKPIKFKLFPMHRYLGYIIDLKTQILSAPINSHHFEKQFIEYITIIKDLVREVTLGKV